MKKLLSCLVTGALATTLALASPAFARGGGGGGMHGGGMHMGGGHFAGGHFAHAGFSPRYSRVAFRDHRFFRHHRFHGFGFVGVPVGYAAYNGCWRRAWTPYGLQWVNACSDYTYY